MKDRYHHLAATSAWPRPGIALRIGLRDYRLADLRADLLAACVVGVVALPLSMALAIASGVPPQYGLYTAIVGGFLIALLGGSPVQVSGPTAAFVVILAPIAAGFGLRGLLLASMMAGIILIAMGLGRFGQLIQFVPYPVTAGFTAGIAVVIGTMQLRDLLGLQLAAVPEHYLDRVVALARALPTWRWQELLIGAVTFALLLLWPRVSEKFPAPLVALGAGAVAAYALAHTLPSFDVATIGSRFSYELDGVRHAGIPRLPPLLVLPWQMPGPDGVPLASTMDLLRQLLPAAFAIAMLGAIESLLSAVVADGMIGTQHDPDAELLAQGVGNLVVPFFGGFAATGAIARTATNIRSGARTPIAAAAHALFLLAAVLALAPLLAYLPMASLAALLLLVAWNMSEFKHVVRSIRTSPRNDVVVLLTCLILTVLFDMVVAVSVGVVMAALLFMRRMADVSSGRLTTSDHHGPSDEPLPAGVLVYEIAGPLFFGAAQKAMGALQRWEKGVKVVVLDLRSVPLIDATGLVNLQSSIARLRAQHVSVVLAGVQPAPLRTLARAGLRNQEGLAIGKSFQQSLERARQLCG